MSAVKPQRKITKQKEPVWGILYLPDGRRTITCSDDASLRVWDLESGKQQGRNWEDKGSGTMWAIALSPGGKEVASGSDDGIVRLWDIETGKVTARWTGHTSEVSSISWSPNGGRLVSGSNDGTAILWNVDSGETILEPIKTGQIYVRTVHYSPDATMIATGGHNRVNEGSVKLWDVKTGELLKQLEANMPVLNEVLCLAWSSDVNTLISGSLNFEGHSLRKFDTATGTQTAVLEGHQHLVKALSLSPNNRILASASSDKTTQLWDIENGQPIGPPFLHEGAVRSAVFSPDGKLLATVCDDHIYTWDAAAIVKEAGFGKLLTASAPKVGGMSILEVMSCFFKPAFIHFCARRMPHHVETRSSRIRIDCRQVFSMMYTLALLQRVVRLPAVAVAAVQRPHHQVPSSVGFPRSSHVLTTLRLVSLRCPPSRTERYVYL
ncbi:WD40 repeat-like protein [Suillus hirtellus]|nr:WD40 repeat-like protein [Suillus hirtellus]